jgi:hypothetical protein
MGFIFDGITVLIKILPTKDKKLSKPVINNSKEEVIFFYCCWKITDSKIESNT